MARLGALLPRGRVLTLLDVALAVWVAVWIALGLAIADEVRGLRALSSTVTKVGLAVEQSGRTLESLDGVPLVGDRLEGAAAGVREAGRSAAESGRASRDSVRDLSLLLALAVALIPSTPVLALYLPLRIAAVRDARALRRMVRAAGADPTLDEFLARRALATLPHRRLAAVARTPWRDVAEGRYERLARAELDWLGVERTPPRDRG